MQRKYNTKFLKWFDPLLGDYVNSYITNNSKKVFNKELRKNIELVS